MYFFIDLFTLSLFIFSSAVFLLGFFKASYRRKSFSEVSALVVLLTTFWIFVISVFIRLFISNYYWEIFNG